jgi:hypothetical protein
MFDQSVMDLWAMTEAADNGFSALPDGKYEAQVMRCAMETTKKTKAPMISWEFKVTSPEQFVNRRVFLNRVLNNENGIKFAKGDFKRLGFEANSANELPTVMNMLLDKIVEITVKNNTKDGVDYQNVFVNKLVEGEATPAPKW